MTDTERISRLCACKDRATLKMIDDLLEGKAVAPVKSAPQVFNAFISYPEAAAMIGASPSTVRRLRRENEIKIAVVRGRERVVRDSVLKYIERVSENGQTVTRKPERVKAA